MTEEVFSVDSYIREFEARVVKLDGRELILDRTAVSYPAEVRHALQTSPPENLTSIL